jgi:hypothetical protein
MAIFDRTDNSFWLSSCGFYGFNTDRFIRAQTINLARMDAIQSKITFDDVGKRSLLCISTAELAATERVAEPTTPWLSNCRFGGFQIDF